MKRAGAKNDGCWARTNKAISKLTADDFAGLVAIVKSKCSTEIAAGFAAMQLIATRTGTQDAMPDTADQWITGMLGSAGSGGVPRSVWMGHLPYTVYDKIGSGAEAVYFPVGQAAFHSLGKVIRKTIRDYIFALRELKDLGNVYAATDGNPGGVADSHLGT